MMMTMTRIKKPIAIALSAFVGSAVLLLISKVIFVNFFLGMLSAMAIVTGSLYSYRNMIIRRSSEVNPEDNKDIIDMMDDPYDLYEEERENEIADIKQMIKEEKARQKSNIIENTTKNGSAWVSIYRLLPYAFLIMGFIALENNHLLEVLPYIAGLTGGIPLGYFFARELFITHTSE